MPRRGRRRSPAIPLAVLLTIALALAACGGGDDEGSERLFSPQDNQLDVYDLSSGEKTVLIKQEQNMVNGQVCLLPDGSGDFLLGEDTGQPEQRMGWGIFSSKGKLVNKIPEPETPNEAEQPEPFGCGFDEEERLFVSDVGTGSFGASDGKLIVFFPPDYDEFCLLDTTLRTAGAIAIDDEGNVYVTEAVPPGKVLRFSPPFPSSADECQTTAVNKSTFIEDPELQTPLGIARAPNGNWYVSSVVIPPAIKEYDANGKLVRTIVEGAVVGNPAGIAVGANGTLYYADLGLEERPPPDFFAPADGEGTVRRVTFDVEGNPSELEIIGSGLSFPDAVSVLP